jgi:hypothetical protein
MIHTASLGRLGVACAVLAGGLVLAPAPIAHASDTLEQAIIQFGVAAYTLSTLPNSGNVTAALAAAAAVPGSADQAHLIYLPSGTVAVSSSIRVADRVYLVAEADTQVTLVASADQLLWFPAGVTAGVYGGDWDAQGRGSASVIATGGARLSVAKATVRAAGKHGIAGYRGAQVSLSEVTATANKVDGVHLEASRLTASQLTSTRNRRNGVQLSGGAVGAITESVLDENGQAVTGSTTGKTGHGMGLSSATAVLTGTSLSANKVCGVSTTGSSSLTLTGSHADRNGRHGLGSSAALKATLTDTTFVGNGYNGVLATGSGTALSLTGVQIANSKQYGISLPSKGAVTLSATSVTGSGKSNIAASNKSKVVLRGDNVISAAKAHGLALASRSTLSITGTGNRIDLNASNGLMLSDKGTSGRISASVGYSGNKGTAVLVRKKAKLWQVAGIYLANRRAVATSSGGKIVKLG